MSYAPKLPTVFVATLVAAFSWTVLTPPSNAGNQPDFPSPLSGPGVVPVKKSQQKKIRRGWEELIAGDLIKSRKRAARAGQVPPARLLGYQILLTEGQTDVTAELRTFCGQYPGYAAGWMTLSVAAERTGSEMTALEAARQGSRLWTTPPWGDRARDLEQKWVDDRIVQARRLFDAESSDAALAELDAADALNQELLAAFHQQPPYASGMEALQGHGQIDVPRCPHRNGFDQTPNRFECGAALSIGTLRGNQNHRRCIGVHGPAAVDRRAQLCVEDDALRLRPTDPDLVGGLGYLVPVGQVEAYKIQASCEDTYS